MTTTPFSLQYVVSAAGTKYEEDYNPVSYIAVQFGWQVE